MAASRNDLLDRVVYLAMRLVLLFVYWWPIETVLRFAQVLGRLLYAVSRKFRERAQGNIRKSFPELSEKQIDAMARSSMQHFFMMCFELLFTTRLVRIDTYARYMQLETIDKTVDLLLRKKGLILLTGHYGNWEVLGYTLATLGFNMSVVARPLDNPYVNEWLLGVREKRGQKMIDKRGATEEVSDVLSKGGAVAFIADQNAGSKGLFVDFFGRKASTFKSIGLLAMEFQVPICVGFARRLDAKFHFRIGVNDIIYPEDWQSRDDPLRYITQRYTSAIEAFVREAPEQYFWVHRRWKSRPKGEAPEE